MADVFISYHKTDNTSKLVNRIAKQLHRRGITYWHMELGSGGVFADKIAQEIFSCRVFLLIFDKESNKSPHVQSEVSLAHSRYPQTTIIPFRIDDSEYSFTMHYYLTLFSFIKAIYPDESKTGKKERGEKELDTDFIQNIKDVINLIDNVLSEKTLKASPSLLMKPKTGACGKDVIYKLQEQGSLSIVGSGKMWNFALAAHAPWWNERETIFSAHIQKGVTSIGDSAFSNCINLTNVDIPYGVTSIGWSAFEGCDSLPSIKIPDSVVYIEGGAFQNCTNLSECEIPDSVTSIGNWAFGNCRQLTNVIIPDSVIYIGGNAFDGCENLISASVPIKLSKYMESAFSDVNIITYRE